ncbi:TonB-linked outer membrane protein, SusC/RagA family [Spirosomataceae bacterium TFI 002]|nr:TonB-linked outer membrane protein, SusC/RagA family [Spirosomataceae bacterium TFI 002]
MTKYSTKQKLLLFMKINLIQIFLAVVFAANAVALPINAQELLKEKVTISLNKGSMKTLLKSIEKQSNVLFSYKKELLENEDPISLDVKNEKVEDVLRKVLLPRNIKFENMGGRQVILFRTQKMGLEVIEEIPNNKAKLASYIPADITIRGTVSDDTGELLPGVSVVVKGTTRGGSTNSLGEYTIAVPDAKTVLVFSFVGYEPKEVLVGNQTQIDVKLFSDIKTLGEVVVVGYGTQKSKDLTGAVATIDQAIIKDLPVASVDQKMIGQVAGVQIQQPSGSPGGGTSIRIRGSGSLGAGNEPLYVIDGLPYTAGLSTDFNPLSLINPNDIESISILKDASSTAIFGSRGANGVIMITTKKGSYNSLKVNVSSMRGVQNVPQKGRPLLMNQQEFVDLQRNKIDIAVKRAENRATTINDYPLEYQNPSQLVGDGTDWYDLLLRTASIQDHNISIQKGTQDSRMNLNLGYYNQEGVVQYTGLERFSANLSFESNISKTVTVGASLQPTFINQNRTNTNSNRGDIIGIANWANPVLSPYDESGNLVPYLQSPSSKYHSAWSFPNPLFALRETVQLQQQFQNLGSTFLEWDIIPNLKARTSLSTIWATSKYNQFNPSTVGSPNIPPVAGTGRSSNARADNFNWLIENTLTYNKTINKHRFNVLAGYTTQKNTESSISLSASPYSNDLIETINGAQAINSWGESANEWSIISYLGRINYAFNDRYLLTVSMRSDGSSRFGVNNRYATFPSVAGAWRISDEPFLKDNPLINSLKIRTSYGKSGNNNIGNYSHLASINPGAYVFGGNQVSASYVGIANPNLTWEESDQIDAGLDGDFFNYRLSMSLDFYNRKSANMLLNDVIPAITGFNSQIVNKGTVRNRGVELSLGGTPVTGDFNWDVNFNIAFNRNKVLSINDNGDRILSGNNDNNPTHVTEVGLPIGNFFGFVLEGVYTAQDLEDPNLVKTAQVYEGNTKYKDVNGDGIVSDFLDYTIIGNPQPKFIYGFSNSFSYKRLTLGVIMNGQYGGQVMNGLRQTTDNLQGFFNVSKVWVDRWKSPEEPGAGNLYGVPKLTPSWGHRVNTLWVEDATFLRISNVSLGYTLPEDLVKKTNFVKSCRIYLTGNNLVTYTKYSGANPEGQSRNIDNTLSPGFDMSSYPLARTTSVGLNLSF